MCVDAILMRTFSSLGSSAKLMTADHPRARRHPAGGPRPRSVRVRVTVGPAIPHAAAAAPATPLAPPGGGVGAAAPLAARGGGTPLAVREGKKERKKTPQPRRWEDRARRHRDFKERSVLLAVAHPRASASSYLSSHSLADSHCNLHATSRSACATKLFSCAGERPRRGRSRDLRAALRCSSRCSRGPLRS